MPRKVEIKGKKIALMLPEKGYEPDIIDLGLMHKKKANLLKQVGNNRVELLRLLSLKTEEDMATDIIKDWKEMGWRLINRE